jgi:hypothetical protein
VKNSDGPQVSGCFSVLTTLGSESLSVFEDKWRPGKAHASENIDAPRLRTLMQPEAEGCGPSESAVYRFSHSTVSLQEQLDTFVESRARAWRERASPLDSANP